MNTHNFVHHVRLRFAESICYALFKLFPSLIFLPGGVIYNVHRDTEPSVKVQYCLFHTQTSSFNDFISQPLRQYVVLH